MSHDPTLPADPLDDATWIADPATSPGETESPAPGARRASADARGVPERLGRYRVLEMLGQGGMGVVFTAYDPELDRKVAIKLLRSSASARARARLQREAQAMAKLSHPNVVPVFDVGMVGDQVFIAMDYVEGQDLRKWMDAETKHDWREVLDIFLAAGRGLAFAHQNEIVHRDFKPDNVLMSGAGSGRRVQVLDFGLAKSLGSSALALAEADEGPSDPGPAPALDLESERDGSASGGPDATLVSPGRRPPPRASESRSTTPTGGSQLDAELTQVGQIMGTPAYMSPEQFRGSDVDATSDQFSFCVALFEGLWGRRPYPGDSIATLAAAVVNGQIAPPPSVSKVPARLWPIIERGLRAEPADRWPSMDALLDALADDPSERRRLLAFGSIAAAAVVGALAWGVTRTPEVVAEAPRCQDTDGPLQTVWGPSQREALAARYADRDESWATPVHGVLQNQLDNWSARWSEARAETCAATEIRAEQSAELMDLRMACYARKLGEIEATIELLTSDEDPPLAKGVELASALPALEPCADAEALRAIVPPPTPAIAAEVERVRGRMAEARSRARAGDTKQALALVDELAEAVAASEYRPLQAEYGLMRGHFQIDAGEHDEGKANLERALSEGLAVRDDEVAGRACEKLVFAIGYTDGDYEGGMRWARIGEALIARSTTPNPRRVMALASQRGLAELAANNFDAARDQVEHALEIAIELDGEDHPGLVNQLDALGAIHLRRGDYAQAGQYFRRTLALAEAGYGPEHTKVAFPLNNLALVHERLAQFDEAAAAFTRVIEILAAGAGEDHPNVGLSRMNLGGVLMLAGRHDEATVEIDAAIDILERALGPDHQVFARALTMRSDLERNMGKFEAAIASAERAETIRRAKLGPDHPELGLTLLSRGQSLLELERYAEAKDALERAVTLLSGEDTDPIDRGLARWHLAQALHATKGPDPRVETVLDEARADLRAGKVRAEADLRELEAWARKAGIG